MESLTHVKNEKKMLKTEVAPEFTKLVVFINDFFGIGDLDKSRGYVQYLIEDLKMLSLLEYSKNQNCAGKRSTSSNRR